MIVMQARPHLGDIGNVSTIWLQQIGLRLEWHQQAQRMILPLSIPFRETFVHCYAAMQTATQEPNHMKLPTLRPLSNLTALTELSLTDTHNRHSLPGLQHLSSLSQLRYAQVTS